ncbi:SMP-30/gluconolactonase/LRE family protein [Roseibacillus ishigakijimensis]|uniref:SMP-30/gluconolactonase/LRE family protein n=1 Tax=Roseibacillus ishigakijimensis TaxID=454146 RepID=A0A934VNX3_9BACT|nr:SMP-30/gluconolactonase/LRE family protein [Roseibacillus ishigakijimensis]MBK1835490.1 SMP-30/gluconolactonase/LRE family protein [Roseibacillus ishigakijimensis]
MEISLAGEYRSQWGEGPIWWQGALYYVDIEGHRVVRFDPESGEEKIFEVGERVGTVVPRSRGGLVIAGDTGFHLLSEETGEHKAIVDPEAEKVDNRFNDGKCSPDGRFFAGTISTVKKEGDASLYELDGELSVREVFGGVTNSNGLAWSPDNRRVYYIDTPRREIWGFDYDTHTGEWSNREVVVDTKKYDFSPDGMVMDAEGKIWVAFCHGGMVVRYDPRTGEELQRLDFPCVETTACTWGGENLDELYVTTGIHKSKEEEHAGRLFVVRGLGVKGLPANAFAG